MSERSIINGYEDGSFRPNQFLSEYQAALMFARALEIDQWRIDDIQTGTHYSHSQLSRYKMAQALTRAFELEGEYFGEIKDINEEQSLFVAPLAAKGVTTIDAKNKLFKPENGVTRAQLSVFMARVFEEDYRKAFPTAGIFVPEVEFFMTGEEVTEQLGDIELLNEAENFNEKNLTFLYENDVFEQPVEMTILFEKNNLVSIVIENQSDQPFKESWQQDTVEWMETFFNQSAVVDSGGATIKSGDITYQVSDERVQMSIDYLAEEIPNKDSKYIRGGEDWNVFSEYVYGPNPPPAYEKAFGESVQYREHVFHVYLDSEKVEFLAQYGDYYNSELFPNIEEEIVIYFYDSSVAAAAEEGYHAYYRAGSVYYGEDLARVDDTSEFSDNWREISLIDLEAEDYLEFDQIAGGDGTWNYFTRGYIPHFTNEEKLAKQTLHELNKYEQYQEREDIEIFYYLTIADRFAENPFAYYRDGKLFTRW
ncbi:hypothetical protein JOD21_000496 [Jeotgalibacillus terrae]|nr:hypothetical protein [Jeotgalibacillus terrae]